jgi:RNA polymerase sigma-70 factor, ECF subfamily
MADGFERLVTLLGPIHERARLVARRLCRSNADGDDLFQETVLHALDHLAELREESRFRPWFFAVLLSVHRRRNRQGFWRRLLPIDQVVDEPKAQGGAIELEGAERMARALATLPPKQREAIVLFELEGFTLDEIAGLQRASIPAVKSRLVRARARLRRHYERAERAPEPVLKEKTS